MSDSKKVIVSWNDVEATVDEDMAPLIQSLWRLGIQTTGQYRDEDMIRIEFEEQEGALRFMNIVARRSEDDDDLYDRVSSNNETDDIWEYDASPGDRNMDEAYSRPDFEFFISIAFPDSDLRHVTGKIVALAKITPS